MTQRKTSSYSSGKLHRSAHSATGVQPEADQLTADIWELPRGLIGEYWDCPFDTDKNFSMVRIQFAVSGRALFTADVLKDSDHLGDQKPSKDCERRQEEELDDEAYARAAATLIRRASWFRDDREQRIVEYSGSRVKVNSKFSFRGFGSGGGSYVEVVMDQQALTPDDINLAMLAAGTEEAAADISRELIGLKARPLGNDLYNVWEVCEQGPNSSFGLLLTDDSRNHLMNLTRNRLMKKCLFKSPEGELLVSMTPDPKEDPRSVYTFVASSVRPSLSEKDMSKLKGLPGWPNYPPFPLRNLQIAAAQRQDQIEEEVASCAQSLKWSPLPRMRQSSSPLRFDVLPTPDLVLAGNSRLPAAAGGKLWDHIQKNGLLHVDSRHLTPTVVGVVIGSKEDKKELDAARKVVQGVAGLLAQVGIKAQLRDLPFFVNENGHAPADVIQRGEVGPGDVLLLFGSRGSRKATFFREKIKLECLKEGSASKGPHIASQWIDLSKRVWTGASPDKFSMQNVASAVAAKLGHVPFGVDASTWAWDPATGKETVAVGYDVCHICSKHARRKHLAAGIRASSHAANGVISNLEPVLDVVTAETVPPAFLRRLIPPAFAQGRVVVVHRDGNFPDEELAQFKRYQQELGGETALVLVEIVKWAGGAPRMYQGTSNAPQGAVVFLNETTAVLVSTAASFGTSNPLKVSLRHIIGQVPESLGQQGWLQSVFDLGFLHFGSLLRDTRLPVTTHFADSLAYQAADAGVTEDDICNFDGAKQQQFWL